MKLSSNSNYGNPYKRSRDNKQRALCTESYSVAFHSRNSVMGHKLGFLRWVTSIDKTLMNTYIQKKKKKNRANKIVPLQNIQYGIRGIFNIIRTFH